MSSTNEAQMLAQIDSLNDTTCGHYFYLSMGYLAQGGYHLISRYVQSKYYAIKVCDFQEDQAYEK